VINPRKSDRNTKKVAQQVDPLPVAGSVLLDVIRFTAAVAVAVGHFWGPINSPYAPDLLHLAISAVAVFFVLSGFVIRLISIGRSITAKEYAIDRVSRIYSVLLPALLITIAVTLCLDRSSSRGAFLSSVPFATIATQFIACMTFTGSLWGLDVPMGFNSVFWSLCYECAYYAFYGIAFFGRGPWRWWLLAGLAVFVGPPILFMLPLWLFGCLICDLYYLLRKSRYPLTAYFAGLLALASLALVLWLAAGFLEHSSGAVALRVQANHFLHWTRLHDLHLLKRSSSRSYFVGIPVGILMLGLLLAAEHIIISRKHTSVSLVRRIADGTFTLYLIHLPIFMLFDAYLPFDHASAWQKLSLLALTLAIAVALAGPTDALKRWLRKALSSQSLQKAPNH
jgi:peptidoglycan/LPS O-acetylase OafA/YrhL